MWITKTMHDGWLSNTWLVADQAGGHAVVIDTGGPIEPILAAIDEQRLELTHVLCTHHHHDHVAHNADYRSRFGCPICAGRPERRWFQDAVDVDLGDGDELVSGDLHVRALLIPGHTAGQLAFLINDTHVFTGDTLFKGSIGGTRAPGHTTFQDIQHSIMDVLMSLPKATRVFPGHMDATTIEAEWNDNPFVRAWRGLDTTTERRCEAFGRPAALVLEARDYDGGTKCQVRFDDGTMDLVPGSRVRVCDGSG